ncbi:MAG TPA: metallophosphoesterase [Armatimonadota bacterium]|nr:metallophosphoesterase [Armatimonadota bacterium]
MIHAPGSTPPALGLKIVALSDTHYARCDAALRGSGAIADILLRRAVHRINRMIQPDVTLLLGDLLENGEGPDAEASWRRLRAIADGLESPFIALPGNHDGDPEAFYRVFPRPGEMLDLKGMRFLIFLDPEEPGYNARRLPGDLARMATAHQGHDGPVVMLQHCSLFPPGTSDCPFNYVNADDITAHMRQHDIGLAISGHFHLGVDLIRHGAGDFVIAPALCEPPFAFLEIELDRGQVSVTRHQLRMPPELELIDCHLHTPFAYCADDMDFPKAVALAQDLGLAGLVFAEHSGQLYYDAETYRRGDFLQAGIATAYGRSDRMARYLATAGAYCPPASLGLEADCDYAGRPVLRAHDRREVAVLLGAVHSLPELRNPRPDPARAADELLAALDRFVSSGINVLAHPFREFRRAGLEPPASLFALVVRLLREHGVAAEINFHTNEPAEAFVRLCIESGVKLALGSDAHGLWQVGEFAPHLRLLRQCGCDGDLGAVLAQVGTCGLRRGW